MMSKLKSIALIPMRGGSKSIPKKNILPLNNKPLFFWSIDSAIKSNCFEKIFISSNCDEIINLVKSYFPDIGIIKRPDEFAKDTSSTEEVIDHFNTVITYETLTLIQVTSPLVKASDFISAHNKFNSDSLDSLFTGVIQKRFIWSLDAKPSNYNPASRPRRQEFDGFIIENGAFYIFTHKNYILHNNRLGGKIGYHIMEEKTLFEIDEPNDFKIIEFLFSIDN
jgi:CMP-N-acetylneuraminic acid synthetase